MGRFHIAAWIALGVLGACNGEDKCADEEKVDAYTDVDGDGFGTGDAFQVCALEINQADNGDDCDDTNPDVSPAATEACNGLDDNCDGTPDEGLKIVDWFRDMDLDGYGLASETITVCAPPDETWARFADDCDDTNENVNPGQTEVCNDGLDDDCDKLADDADDTIDVTSFGAFYPDLDGDTFPRAGTALLACAAPAEAASVSDYDGDGDDDFDCNDNDAYVNPAAQEICNGGADDDCDTLRDDLDDSLDPSGQIALQADADGDGDGDPKVIVYACLPIPGVASANTLDCDDTNADINVDANEVLCDLVDNDCDAVTADDRDTDLDLFSFCGGDCADNNGLINPGALELASDGIDQNCDLMELCYEDADLDGSRTEDTILVSDPECNDAGNARATQPLDCDDTDATITIAGDWETDSDQDGYGDGIISLTDQCTDPGPGWALVGGELDCNDGDAAVNPGQTVDVCNDGVDADCNTLDSCTTCAEVQATGSTASGVYPLRPDGGDVEVDVYCDLVTDGGGWTLVSSSTLPPKSFGGAYHAELNTLSPLDPHTNVWNGLQDLILGTSDLRFACKLDPLDAAFTVDLSFYDTDWYAEIVSSGTDAGTCFSETGAEDQPARRNNVTGEFKDTTDAWDFTGGGMIGEDTCADAGDFTVDFDDRGMDGQSESDGTDWGEDDGKSKCALSNSGGAWFVFVRE
jgi:Putative metal-binding motif/Fibrinogen beta and gamma chains, C-terminal globular domain